MNLALQSNWRKWVRWGLRRALQSWTSVGDELLYLSSKPSAFDLSQGYAWVRFGLRGASGALLRICPQNAAPLPLCHVNKASRPAHLRRDVVCMGQHVQGQASVSMRLQLLY